MRAVLATHPLLHVWMKPHQDNLTPCAHGTQCCAHGKHTYLHTCVDQVAPEILKGLAYGKAVDMWSIGVICFILLGGYPPFHDENKALLYKKIKRGQFTFHPQVHTSAALSFGASGAALHT